MRETPNDTKSPQVVGMRALLALVLPPMAAAAVALVAGSMTNLTQASTLGTSAVLMAAIGVASLIIGLRWYGSAEMGLRGGRPLFAGIGFAVLGWLAFILLRFYFMPIAGFGLGNESREFVYLLLFEAFAIQIWTFGLLFRALSDWRGGLTAAVTSGVAFGLAATVLFQEAFVGSWAAVAYFVAWGVLYGLIRLRTGSLIGAVIVQALQSFTAWTVLTPSAEYNPANLTAMYLIAAAVYLVICWRLWPKQISDYRI